MTSSQPASPTPSRWVAPAALLIAEIAIGVAIWALVRTPGEAAVNAQQSDDAKARVCVAFDMVRKAVSVRTNADLGPDPVAKAGGSQRPFGDTWRRRISTSRLDGATAPELADAVRSFANNLEDIGMNQLVGVPNTDPTVAARLSEAQAASRQIADICK